MFISKQLSQKFHTSEAHVLLLDGHSSDGPECLVIRKVEQIWGHYEATGKKGGVYFNSLLSDNRGHVNNTEILGYNTGDRASVQELLLYADVMWTDIPHEELLSYIHSATQSLLDSQTITNPLLTVERLTTPKYWFLDTWYGQKLNFVRLRDAKKHARSQTGMQIPIFDCQTGEIVCITPASGQYLP